MTRYEQIKAYRVRRAQEERAVLTLSLTIIAAVFIIACIFA